MVSEWHYKKSGDGYVSKSDVSGPDKQETTLALAAKTAYARLTAYMKTERRVDPADGASGEI